MAELIVGPPRRFGAVTVIPLIRARARQGSAGGAVWVRAERAAAAVVVVREGELRAYSVDGCERDVRALAATLPQLARLLEDAGLAAPRDDGAR